jgi:hypothetical protein
MQRTTRRGFLKKVGIIAVAAVAGVVSGVGIYDSLSKQSTTTPTSSSVSTGSTGFGSKLSYAEITCFDVEDGKPWEISQTPEQLLSWAQARKPAGIFHTWRGMTNWNSVIPTSTSKMTYGEFIKELANTGADIWPHIAVNDTTYPYQQVAQNMLSIGVTTHIQIENWLPYYRSNGLQACLNAYTNLKDMGWTEIAFVADDPTAKGAIPAGADLIGTIRFPPPGQDYTAGFNQSLKLYTSQGITRIITEIETPQTLDAYITSSDSTMLQACELLVSLTQAQGGIPVLPCFVDNDASYGGFNLLDTSFTQTANWISQQVST